jgi:hypothetical protein
MRSIHSVDGSRQVAVASRTPESGAAAPVAMVLWLSKKIEKLRKELPERNKQGRENETLLSS